VAGYRVAGKTGTAQIPVPGGYLRNGYLPSFVGFAPADRPALVGVVAVAEPRGFAYHGSQVAAPVFGAIVRQVLLYRGVHPERERPAVWPGQVVTASLPPSAPATSGAGLDSDDALADGDDWAIEAGPDPVLWRGPAPPAAPEGGRSHAPF
jgi:hypothetical protein